MLPFSPSVLFALRLAMLAASIADLFGDSQEYFDKNIRPLVESIAKAEKLVLYEGLPHAWEKDLLAEELKAKKSVTVHGFPFYDPSIAPAKEDAKQLSILCSSAKSFRRYRGQKLCGGYHPDWCIEWKDGETVLQVLVCFGCHEARLYSGKSELWTDVDKEAYEKLVELLNRYRKNRPEPSEKK